MKNQTINNINNVLSNEELQRQEDEQLKRIMSEIPGVNERINRMNERLSNLSIAELNKTLTEDAQIEIVPKYVFDQFHKNRGTKLERMVASIKSVHCIEDGYEMHLDNYKGGEKIIQLKFNGKVSINGSSFRELIDSKSMHIRVNHNNNSICVEKLIGICKCIRDEALPMSFKGLCVNVKTGTGNIVTAEKLGITPDYNLNNLEWTLNYRNLKHGKMILPLFELTGKVYRFSANDDGLNQIYATKNTEYIKEYLEKNYVAVN